jgi:epoxyqueuosine reductase
MAAKSTSDLTQALKSEAYRLGFTLVGACPAVTPTGFHHLIQWLEAGYAGEMEYLASRLEAYQHPSSVLPEVRSLLMLGLNYQTEPHHPAEPGTGRISRYAWGQVDYHDLMRSRLKALEGFGSRLFSEAGITDPKLRGIVDTTPLLEREFGQLAGLGWRGKNTMLIHPKQGSWFFLAALLVNVELEYDQPMTANHCGTCTACLDQCPTNAFVEPGVLDATRCISYLTIEHRSPIELGLREQMDNWILGCDICQEVCPWNRKAPKSTESDFSPLEDQNPIALRGLFWLSEQDFRDRFRHTPLWRPKRRGILRNAAIALGNRPHEANIAALQQGLNDAEPLVRGASAWALGRSKRVIQEQRIDPMLHLQLEHELDAEVIEEIQLALKVCAISLLQPVRSAIDRFEP